ncbi:hypothetical protein [Xanthomonas vesicatoria]|uniref:hypothetical protein n=1 Tax=Xanthomonas vesicatoria TaxID=56460 RepID=UPI000731FA83|nr:hypothetical protein [Xanthomonas vesicatoria]KTF36227.1 hypothetical protein LMG919_12430 [Xanthomonas vesicatoria]MCC8556701.1 hypothetical protein [Xanthomonas vesicatoria]MCC8599746.1 hypothetical protein [Xanthomonas vesicatoria]MCC8609747.1 hypothetical protein [Xanthomonas vesicatoria]MCC8626946.1 hypothetical protein [Xanthomonas vesicatoria]
MKTAFLSSALIAALATCGAAYAGQYMDAQALSAAATGERFKSGSDSYRMLPGMVVSDPAPDERSATPPAAAATARLSSTAASATGKVAARIGLYAVVLPSTNAARSASTLAATSNAPTERTLAAAVNERNGRVVLVQPQLKLTNTTPDSATALATSSGGRIVYTSRIDNSAVIAYPSIEKTQQALTRLRASQPGIQAALVVQQSVMQPM